ncbi:response regulator [Sporosarcina sp. Marseille-Q4063]|uniref:response regulator n=1 Tax=Sporosarcina sp. Marseille-Q4063 TaxID=2810514 RepID=UPI001BAFBF3B|nr:response regulator [Sporosarcina sp. Marseille-Q4063]QUW23890.1 response regulator [Sporosarcina sp. Marseille-Q4063]
MRYFIVDDDTASRRMLAQIITEGGLGAVIGEAESGKKSLSFILSTRPDFVLIDFLMPELDGIETIEQLQNEGFQGQFIMISQVVNKEMVGEAYERGVEYFIHKPINRIEVSSILKKTAEQFQLKNSLLQIRESLVNLGPNTNTKTKTQRNVKETVLSILNDMGIVGEAGSDDIVSMIEILMENGDYNAQVPSLKELYEAVAKKMGAKNVEKECKAIEQRIRRTIIAAVNNLASLGSIDYTNPEFEYYAPRYFDFGEIRSRMKQIQENDDTPMKVKINSRKFLQMLYREVIDKYNQP